MAVCDICMTPGEGTKISSDQAREAVLDNGFNPFARGLVPNAPASPEYFERWKETIVKQDTSDWNLCSGCLEAIRPHFTGAPAPAGVSQSRVPRDLDPVSQMVLGPLVKAMEEEKRKKEEAGGCWGFLGLVAIVAGAYFLGEWTEWGFWLSLGAIFGGVILIALIFDLLFRRKKPS